YPQCLVIMRTRISGRSGGRRVRSRSRAAAARRYPARMGDGSVGIASDLAPSGALRAAINLGNPVLAQGTSVAPTGVTVDIGREIAARLGLGVEFFCFHAARDSL